MAAKGKAIREERAAKSSRILRDAFENELGRAYPGIPRESIARTAESLVHMAEQMLGDQGNLTWHFVRSAELNMAIRVATGDLAERFNEIFDSLSGQSGRRPPARETSTGAGIGTVSAGPERAARLGAMVWPIPLEQWAGEVLGPVELSRRTGIPRSTLDSWRRRGEVIAFPKGVRTHVYPVEQFRDGAPLRGLGAVLAAASGNPRVAWRWLRTPSGWLDRTRPIDALLADRVDAVIDAAERDLG